MIKLNNKKKNRQNTIKSNGKLLMLFMILNKSALQKAIKKYRKNKMIDDQLLYKIDQLILKIE